MKFCLRHRFWLMALLPIFSHCRSVKTPLKEGRSLADLTLSPIRHYSSPGMKVRELEGKWVVLFFWNKQSRGSVREMVTLNGWQDQYPGYRFIPVAGDDSATMQVYERYREHYHLTLPQVFNSAILKRLSIREYPFYILLDPKGIVRGMTPRIKSEDLADLGRGIKPSLYPRNEELRPLVITQPLNSLGNEGTDSQYVYRSLLAAWKPWMAQEVSDFTRQRNWSTHALKNGIQEVGVNLQFLYMIAYFGLPTFFNQDSLFPTLWKRPVTETVDSVDFEGDFLRSKNIYNYSLIVPREKANDSSLQRLMQRNLKDYFGYEASVEFRKMPVWKLRASPGAQQALRSKGVFTNQGYDHVGGLYLENAGIEWLISKILLFHPNQPPIIDETGIEGNIDIRVEAIMTDWEDIKRALAAKGLSLLKGEKEMKVLVIRSPKKARS